MTLAKDIKEKITNEYNSWLVIQYGDKTLEERQALGAFYTPPEITIQMIEKFNNLDGTILDPCAGAGGLLAACIIAGADPNSIYANEFDYDTMLLCKKRLEPMGVPEWHIHQGDALDSYCYDFSPEYVWPKQKYEEVSLF